MHNLIDNQTIDESVLRFLSQLTISNDASIIQTNGRCIYLVVRPEIPAVLEPSTVEMRHRLHELIDRKIDATLTALDSVELAELEGTYFHTSQHLPNPNTIARHISYIRVPGKLSCRPNNGPVECWEIIGPTHSTKRWKTIGSTPSIIHSAPDHEYRFDATGLEAGQIGELVKSVLSNQISQLVLWDCSKMSDFDLVGISELVNLEQLTLHNGKNFTSAGMAYLSALSNLQELHISSCGQIGDEIVRHFSKCRHLECLSIDPCYQLSDTSAEYMSRLKKLKRLRLSYCNLLSNIGIGHLAKSGRIVALALTNCDITPAGCEQIINLEHLHELDLSECDELNDECLEHIGQLPYLKNLFLLGCEEITDDGLGRIASFSELEVLDLGGCENITTEGLKSISCLNSLQGLRLSGCRKITDNGLFYLSKLDRLARLDLSHCPLLTDTALAHLSKLSYLREICLESCPLLTSTGISNFLRLRPKCELVDDIEIE